MRNIFLADNQDLTKAGWIYLIRQMSANQNFEEVSDKKSLLHRCSQHANALIIIDYNLFDFQSADEMIMLQEKYTGTDWIICADQLTEEVVRTLLFKSTHFSIILKDSPAEDFQSALKQALKGDRYISSFISNMLLEISKPKKEQLTRPILTVTEQEILKEMALGKTTREIAEQRNASIHTIMTHRKNIFRKIEVNTVHEATKYAMRAGLIDLAEYYI